MLDDLLLQLVLELGGLGREDDCRAHASVSVDLAYSAKRAGAQNVMPSKMLDLASTLPTAVETERAFVERPVRTVLFFALAERHY